MFASKLRRLIIGTPLATAHQHHELISKRKALALLAADALSSTAYATMIINPRIPKAMGIDHIVKSPVPTRAKGIIISSVA